MVHRSKRWRVTAEGALSVMLLLLVCVLLCSGCGEPELVPQEVMRTTEIPVLHAEGKGNNVSRPFRGVGTVIRLAAEQGTKPGATLAVLLLPYRQQGTDTTPFTPLASLRLSDGGRASTGQVTMPPGEFYLRVYADASDPRWKVTVYEQQDRLTTTWVSPPE